MYRYKVIKNQLLTPSVRSLTLKTEDSTSFLFEPGQYVAISMYQKGRPTTTRCFSIASSPTDRRSLEICARVKGRYTTAMKNLTPGDTIILRGPFGHFVLNEETQKRLTLFAGGIGITPFMSMIRYANNLKLPNDIHLVYSCRDQNDIAFLEELIEIEKNNPNFRTTFVIAGGETDRLKGRDVIVGRVSGSNVSKLGLKFSEDTCMICGPAPYIKAMRDMLSSYGISGDRLLSEAFGQGRSGQSDIMRRWPFNTYTLAGLSFVLAIFLVTASDLLNTLPKLKEVYESIPLEKTKTGKVTTLLPQVSTDISQEPITRHISSTGVSPKVVSPTPPKATVVAPPVTPRPVTVTPTVRPRTQVS